MASQIAGMYDLEETLGSGHFAVVKSARHAFTGEYYQYRCVDIFLLCMLYHHTYFLFCV